MIMNRVNLLEVYYGFYRDDGRAYADQILENVIRSPIKIGEFNEALFLEAGRIIATYKLSLADSIALAQASVLNGEFLTADHHEFDAIEKKETIRFHWIR